MEIILSATPNFFPTISTVVNTVWRFAALYVIAFAVVAVDDRLLQLNGHVRHAIRNFIVFLSNFATSFVLDASALLIIWALVYAITLPIGLLARGMAQHPQQYINAHATDATKQQLRNFIGILKLLGWAITLHSWRFAMHKFNVPFAMTISRVIEYHAYVTGNVQNAPLPPMAIGRLIGADAVVDIAPVRANNNNRRRRPVA